MKRESKYQPEVDELMKKLKADGVFIAVIGGERGVGCGSTIRADLIPVFAELLWAIASDLVSGQMENVSRVEVRDDAK